ncbi:MAG: M3 family metallopeptidase [Pseudohongiellaceae bacterium]
MAKIRFFNLYLTVSLALTGCSDQSMDRGEATVAPATTSADTLGSNTDMNAINPFFEPSDLYFSYPPFDRIRNEHFLPAYGRGMAEQLAEVEAIVMQEAEPDFDNTFVALEASGRLLHRVSAVFNNLAGAHTNDEIRAIQQELSPRLAAHDDSIVLNPELFARIEKVYLGLDELDLDSESRRLVEKYYSDFVRAGARLPPEGQQRLREVNIELAGLQTDFSQNVLREINEMAVVVDSTEELTGLDGSAVRAAALEAGERGLDGRYVLTLQNTTQQPPLAHLQNRGMRQQLLEASLARGNRGGPYDNRDIMAQVLRLRAERAGLLGYTNYAAYVLEDQTAGSVSAVNDFLGELSGPATRNARQEAEMLQQQIIEQGGNFRLQAWDWPYYAEQVRMERFDFDDSRLRPYFELDRVLSDGVFHAAEQLYGITFQERTDLPVYHEDVRVFEVFDTVGTTLAIFIADYYARPSKRGGAWMSSYVSQNGLLGEEPIVANHLNIGKPPPDEPTLLTFDEVTTLFHEFGHTLHGMFSNVRYPYFSGTRVPRDFVEYPSQVNEMWATWPEVLGNYAFHYQTGEPMPAELLERVLAARQFNQGYETTEYLAASILDQALHQLPVEQIPDADELMAMETSILSLADINLPEVPPRYRTTYFSHIIGGYAAGYYSYIWSEVLDADTVEWFRENGGLTRENGNHFRQTLLSQGGSAEPMSLFRQFRGRDPDTSALLERRGLRGDD